MTSSPFASIQSPFARLRSLREGISPGASPIDLSLGEPKHGAPAIAAEIIADRKAGFSKYPPIGGIPEMREAIAGWLERRYPALEGQTDPGRHIVPLNGSREGLFSALFPARARKKVDRPAVLMPNPFYQAYFAAAIAGQCEPVLLPATAETGFLPDLDALAPELLERTVAFYLASPANPQGAVASPEYLGRAVELARQHDFMLFVDECYSEIYADVPPSGALEAGRDEAFRNVLAFNSLSKRSSAPGLRSGFVAGDPDFLATYLAFRNVACPQIPLPIQYASAALWSDEAHVAESRELYRRKFELAGKHLGALPGFSMPAGGFFLWLDLSDFDGGEAAAARIWKDCGVKILPGAYLAQPDETGSNPGFAYARIALVESLDVMAEAFERLARVLLR